jgi:cyclopropane-fatty-acyl-phospholipid synthase
MRIRSTEIAVTSFDRAENELLAVDVIRPNFETRWPEIQAIDPERFTERFRRIWTYYLSGVIEDFRPGGGNLALHHITFTKGKDHYPKDRRSIYAVT